MDIFSFETHIQFLQQLFREKKTERGFLSRLSEALQVHPSYLSRVLKGENNLTLDQGFAIANWLGMHQLESEYFSKLIQRDRAGNHLFKESLGRDLEHLRDSYNDIGKDFNKRPMANAAETIYYSNWIYSAIHILLTIKEYNSAMKIAKALRVKLSEVEVGLKVLESIGIVVAKNDNWILANEKIFLSNVAPFAQCFHNAWSDRLNSTLSVSNPEHIRYSGIHSISKSDWVKLRTQIKIFLKSIDKQVSNSKEETLIALRLDAGELI